MNPRLRSPKDQLEVEASPEPSHLKEESENLSIVGYKVLTVSDDLRILGRDVFGKLLKSKISMTE